MSSVRYQIWQCQNKTCGFRFPVKNNSPLTGKCPKCGKPVKIVEDIDNSSRVMPLLSAPPLHEVEALLDNIRSALNVGSMFRTADGCGLRHMHLCGMTPTPDNPKVSKTSLGAEYSLPWSYYNDGIAAVSKIKQQGSQIWALEGGENSQSLFDVTQKIPEVPIVLIVGNEVTGVDPTLLSFCDRVVHIPMIGWKRSLNVAVAFGIAAYSLRFRE